MEVRHAGKQQEGRAPDIQARRTPAAQVSRLVFPAGVRASAGKTVSAVIQRRGRQRQAAQKETETTRQFKGRTNTDRRGSVPYWSRHHRCGRTVARLDADLDPHAGPALAVGPIWPTLVLGTSLYRSVSALNSQVLDTDSPA